MAKRDSKNRSRGTIYQKDVNITSKRFLEKILGEVFPTIRRKMHFCTKVVVQFDNASSHGTANADVLKRLKEDGARKLESLSASFARAKTGRRAREAQPHILRAEK